MRKAAAFCAGRDELESAIGQMLVQCFEKQAPPESPDAANSPNDAAALTLYFSMGLPPKSLKRTLENLSVVKGKNTLIWNF